MKDTSGLSDDNELKGIDTYEGALRRLAEKFASWHNVAAVAATEDLGVELWQGGLYRLMQLTGDLAQDLALWLQAPDVLE